MKMNNTNKITNAVTAALMAIGTYYLSKLVLPESLLAVSDLIQIALTGIAGAVGVWVGNMVYRMFKTN